MITALVTGGTGFLGSHIARMLIEAGHQVRILRRANSPLSLIADLPVEHAIGDIMDTDSLDLAMHGCQWVFHVAATSDYWRNSKTKLYLINVNGTENVLSMAQRNSIQRVIFTSSGAAVGLRNDGTPSTEQDEFNLKPESFPYGHSKWLAEQACWQAVEKGLDVLAVNPSVVLGPGDLNQISGSVVVEMARGHVAIYPAGGVTAIDVRDVARYHVLAAEKGQTGHRYLLGTEHLSHKIMLNMVADVVGRPRPRILIPAAATPVISTAARILRGLGVILPIDADQVTLSAKNIYFDCHKAWTTFGLPQITVRQSVEDTYTWYRAQGIIQ